MLIAIVAMAIVVVGPVAVGPVVIVLAGDAVAVAAAAIPVRSDDATGG